jgi:flagellar basal body-associated protein FliL
MSFQNQDDTTKDKQSEDDFGLPTIDYKPLDQLQDQDQQEPTNETTEASIQSAEPEFSSSSDTNPTEKVADNYTAEEETKSKAPVIIGIIIIVVVALAGYLIFNYVIKPNQEKERLEQLTKAENERRSKENAERLKKEEEERKRRETEQAVNAKPAEGTIESLTARTGRYYVVVASAIDADLVMDYAKKLSANGVSSKILPPFGKSKFSRITISDHDSFAAGQTAADAAKAEYGNAVWVIKY